MRRYFEFAIAILVVAVLALALMAALGRLQGDMEDAAMQAEAAAIRAELLERVVHRETFGGSLPASDNPLDWVSTRPANYLGATDSEPARRSVWYFNERSRELVYLHADGRQTRFRLSRSAGTTGARGVLAGIGLQRVDAGRQ